MNKTVTEMNDFINYLQKQGFAARTIKEDVLNVDRFLMWLKEKGYYNVAEIGYNDILEFIQQERSKQLGVATINLRLNSISKYLDFIKSVGEIEKNPLKTLRLKGGVKKVLEHPLSFSELEKLHNEYSSLKYTDGNAVMRHHRNTVILGLMIWQGLHSGEIRKLRTEYIKLRDAVIYIPSTGRSNSRELKLSPLQILPLHQYLEEVRPNLNPANDALIPGSVFDIVNDLVESIRGINPMIKNAMQIRSSIILHWLKNYNKRQVQYMAGHRYVSSLEKYAQQDMDMLTDGLAKHHPFG